MQPQTPRLRPMGLADLLDASFALYRRDFALFAGISALLGVPESIISAFVTAVSHSTVTTTNVSSTSNSSYSFNYFSTGGGGLLSLIFGTLISGALAYAISRRYLGEKTTIEGAYLGVGRRGFLRLFGAVLLGIVAGIGIILVPLIVIIIGAVTGLAVVVAIGALLMVAAVVFDLVVFVHWIFAPQAIVIEGLGVVDGLRRSWRLVRGTAWRVVGVVLVISIMVSILTGIVAGILGAFLLVGGHDRGVTFLVSLLAALVGVLVQPFQWTAYTLLYFDLRIRKEGFDLEHMVRTLDQTPGQ